MSVERAVETLRNTVHGENVSVEEDASLIGSIGCRMAAIIGCLGVAIDCTCGRVVALSLTEWVVFVTQVGVLTLSIQRSVDGTR